MKYQINCKTIITFSIIILILFAVVPVIMMKEDDSDLRRLEGFKNDDDCRYTEDSDLLPLMSANIPDDPQTRTDIGYNLKYVIDQTYPSLTGEDKSCVRLIKPLLKYDGIYKSVRTNDGEVEKQQWVINNNNKEAMGYYGSNKLLR